MQVSNALLVLPNNWQFAVFIVESQLIKHRVAEADHVDPLTFRPFGGQNNEGETTDSKTVLLGFEDRSL